MIGKYVVVWHSTKTTFYLRRTMGRLDTGDFYSNDIKQAVTFDTYPDMRHHKGFGDEAHIVMSVDPPVTIKVLE